MAQEDQQQEKPSSSGCCIPNTPDRTEAKRLVHSLKQDLTLMGIVALGEDGVLRSLTADRSVVDAIGLSPAQIGFFRRTMPDEHDHPQNWEGVDGTQVPKEQWFHPDPSVLPPPLSEDKREEARKMIEQNPEKFREHVAKIEKMGRGQSKKTMD